MEPAWQPRPLSILSTGELQDPRVPRKRDAALHVTSPAVFRPGAFTGETTSLPVGQALLSEVRHQTTKIVPPHVHELDYFSILLDGSYQESAPDFFIRYEPYSLVFHCANREHQDEITSIGTRIFFIELHRWWSDVLRSIGAPRAHFFELHGGEPTWLALRIYREFVAREADIESLVEPLLFELCSFAVDGTLAEKEPPWIAAVDERLQHGFAGSLSITNLAGYVGVHPAHLCRTFRRFRGRSIGDYVRGLRIQFVCRQLATGSESLSGIATAAGFADQSHMTKAFRRLTGYGPGAYREHIRAAAHP